MADVVEQEIAFALGVQPECKDVRAIAADDNVER
jgi:hypothetical protein